MGKKGCRAVSFPHMFKGFKYIQIKCVSFSRHAPIKGYPEQVEHCQGNPSIFEPFLILCLYFNYLQSVDQMLKLGSTG